MGENKENDAYEEELLDYEEDDEKIPDSATKVNGESAKKWDLRASIKFSVFPNLYKLENILILVQAYISAIIFSLLYFLVLFSEISWSIFSSIINSH